jgi:hypothetical protein
MVIIVASAALFKVFPFLGGSLLELRTLGPDGTTFCMVAATDFHY